MKGGPERLEARDDFSAGVRTDWQKVWLISALSWLVIAIVEAGTTYSFRLARHSPVPFWMMFQDVLAHNILGAVVTPAIYKLALAFPFAAKNVARPLLIHFTGAITLALLNAAWH